MYSCNESAEHEHVCWKTSASWLSGNIFASVIIHSIFNGKMSNVYNMTIFRNSFFLMQVSFLSQISI